MNDTLSPVEAAKYAAARHAAGLIEDGMRVGLGTGSTAAWLVRCLGERRTSEGLRFRAVPTSRRTADQARRLELDVVTLDDVGRLDMTIDGADEFDADLALIKGGGGALLHEKIVATASDRMVVIADAAKEVGHLGAFALPVEVIPFGLSSTQAQIEELLAGMQVLRHDVVLRGGAAHPFRTDEGNHILDLDLGRIEAPHALALALNQIPGVVENGLFVDICDEVVIGHSDGRIERRRGGDGTIEHDRVEILPRNAFSDLDV